MEGCYALDSSIIVCSLSYSLLFNMMMWKLYAIFDAIREGKIADSEIGMVDLILMLGFFKFA